MSAATSPPVVTAAILVRAPAAVVYGTLTDVDGWGAWWPACRTARATAGTATGSVPSEDGDRHRLELPVGPRRLRLDARAHGWRHEAGLHLAIGGRHAADVEWWLEAVAAGTVVHLIVRPTAATTDRAAVRLLRALGAGQQALKDHLELAVAHALGLVP